MKTTILGVGLILKFSLLGERVGVNRGREMTMGLAGTLVKLVRGTPWVGGECKEGSFVDTAIVSRRQLTSNPALYPYS